MHIFKKKISYNDYLEGYYTIPKIIKNYDLGLACLMGRRDIVEFIINRFLSWRICKLVDDGLVNACQAGNLELVYLMFQMGADDASDAGLYYACLGGHFQIAKLMIEKGARDMELGLDGAFLGGDIELAKLMIKHGAKDLDTAFNRACNIYCIKGKCQHQKLLHHLSGTLNLLI